MIPAAPMPRPGTARRRIATALCALGVALAGRASLAADAAPAGAGASAGTAAAPARPVRVATLIPFVADALAGVPQHAMVVASVRRSMHELPPAGAIDLGSPHAPSLEQLAAARPDLVVADRAMHAARAAELGRFGAAVLLVDTSSVGATFASLREVGARVGAGATLDERVRAAEAAIAGLELASPVDTLALFGTPAAFLVITDRTWQGDLLGRLNLRNLAAATSGRERVPGYAEISDEVIVGMRPRLIVIVAHGDPVRIREAFLQRLDEGPWRGLRDSAAAGVHVLDPALFGNNPGLAMPEAARHLRGLAAPAVAASPADAAR